MLYGNKSQVAADIVLPSGLTERFGRQEEMLLDSLDLEIIHKDLFGRRLMAQTGYGVSVDMTLR